MQLKIITRKEIFRFDQKGQPVTEITEPYVNVEAYTREDVIALYDQNEEHLVHAFKYDGEEITGLSEQAGDSIQNFFLAEGAWYLQALNQPEDDKKEPEALGIPATTEASSADSPVAGAAPSTTPSPSLAGDPPSSLGSSVFIPSEQQRDLLRDIQVTVRALSIIKPDAAAPWDRQVQKLLLSQQLFGIDDLEKAYREGETKVTQLVAQAKSSGVPEAVIESNVMLPDEADVDDPEEHDEEE
jgi:hypothetical protein